ncbi:MAG: sulfatase-like hydrolase/transferase [Dichotomicrobium sp.]
MPSPKNLVILMSDEHNPRMLGCYGHPLVQTPNIDALAARGTRFSAAYCNSPVCVPARASFATGRYVHQIGYWDNAHPYDGRVESWHHRLRATGHRVDSIGKLHFRSTEDDVGFSESQIPMNVIEGKGDLMGLVRDQLPVRGASWKMADFAGPGESMYTTYDREITARSQVWLREEAPRHQDAPWVLFVSFVCPHFPLTAPPEHYYRYYNDSALEMPKLYAKDERPDHPYLREYAESFNYDDYFDTPEKVRAALAGYMGLCSFVDENVGKVLETLDDCGLNDDTVVMYLSDHGDNVGARGLWGKSNMYEEVVGVPWVMAGPGVPENTVCRTPVSHVDTYPTVLECAGVPLNERERTELPGGSLFEVANGRHDTRTVFAEYHGMGSTAAFYMLRDRRYKYVYYIKYPPQLFDLEKDPEELVDRADDPAYADIRADLDRQLRAVVDPEATDERAKRDQAALMEKHGGREAVIARGDLGFSPPPGVAIDLQ